MYEETKDFSQLMADRRMKLTAAKPDQEARSVAQSEPVSKDASEPMVNFPFKRFNDLTQASAQEPVAPVTVEEPVTTQTVGFAQPAAQPEATAEIVEIPAKSADEEAAETADADVFQKFYEATYEYAYREIERLRAKVSKSDAMTRDRLTARFGYGNEWRAYADRRFLDVVAYLERLEVTAS